MVVEWISEYMNGRKDKGMDEQINGIVFLNKSFLVIFQAKFGGFSLF